MVSAASKRAFCLRDNNGVALVTPRSHTPRPIAYLMQTVQVSLADRPYPIHIGPGLVGNSDALAPFVKGTGVAIVTNETLAPMFLARAKAVERGDAAVELAQREYWPDFEVGLLGVREEPMGDNG